MCIKIMENKRGKNMNKECVESLLDLVNKLVKLVGTNTDHINELADEIAKLKAKK